MGLLDWGDVPTWIGGAGALGAAWFAYQTITSQRQQIGEQREFIAEQSRFMAEQKQNLELERVELRGRRRPAVGAGPPGPDVSAHGWWTARRRGWSHRRT
ncbi:hypothetical protein [Streptomyces sp. KR55]|uniref:hypothetical protein n=1 Tax=Streptomyces sp. KR55 TaxID=3457425 RepID=UPI003FD2DE01